MWASSKFLGMARGWVLVTQYISMGSNQPDLQMTQGALCSGDAWCAWCLWPAAKACGSVVFGAAGKTPSDVIPAELPLCVGMFCSMF